MNIKRISLPGTSIWYSTPSVCVDFKSNAQQADPSENHNPSVECYSKPSTGGVWISKGVAKCTAHWLDGSINKCYPLSSLD